MASPQCENGHTQIANEIIEVLCRTNLSGLHLRIILIVIRFTFGFKRKEHQLSIRFIAKALNSSPNRVSEALKKLIEANIIHRVREGNKNHQPQVIKFNKDYDTWIVEQSDTGKQSAPGKQSDVGKHISPIEVNSNSPIEVNKEIKEKEKLKKGDELFETLIPLKLRGNGFLKIWEEWIRYRKEIKKPIKSTTAKKQLKLLNEVADPKAVIEKSILNGWQGLFPDETHNTTTARNKEPERIYTNLN